MRKESMIALLVLSIITFSASFAGSIAQTANGEITITKYNLERIPGRHVTFSVFQPSDLPSFMTPIVLTIHGISGSREAMLSYNIELARRNFTVVSVDLPGHGLSSETFGFDSFFDGIADAYYAIEYVQSNLPNVDPTSYAVLGHSLGAGISLLFQTMPVSPNATIIIGGGMGENVGGLQLPLNTTNPRNLLIASGRWDELVSPDVAYETLRIATGMENVTEGMTYGNFSEGTARRLVLSNTNHLFEIYDPTLISESVEWLVNALQPLGQLTVTLEPAAQVHQFAALFALIATASFVLTLIPLSKISYTLLSRKFEGEGVDEADIDRPNPSIRSSFVMSFISSLLFLALVLAGFGFDFSGFTPIRVSFGSGLLLFSIVHFAFIRWYLRKRAKSNVLPVDLRSLGTQAKHLSTRLLRGYLMLIPIMLWLVAWSIGTDIILGGRVGVTPQVLSGGALSRGIATALMAIAFIPLFYVDSIWLNSGEYLGNSLQHNLKHTLTALVHRLGGYVLLLIALYLPFFLGIPLGFVMFIALLMVPFLLIFGISVVVLCWVKPRIQSSLYISLLNALLLAIIVGSTFQVI